MNEQELADLFARLGAPDPQAWAHSQLADGIPQLARHLFARQALRNVIRPDDRNWMSEMRPKHPDDPGGEIGPAIDRLLAAGARIEDVTIIVRTMQRRFVARFCALLDDPGNLEREVGDIRWLLFLVDQDDAPIAPMPYLLGSLLAIDPALSDLLPSGRSLPYLGGRLKSSERPSSGSARSAPADAKWRSMDEQKLAEVFRKLGAREPESWARSQIREGIPQLARYLFLRQAWRLVVNPEDRNWVSEISRSIEIGEGAEIRQAIERIVARCARISDLTTVIRVMQWTTLARLILLLDQPWDLDDEITDDDIWWGLAVVDENDNPIAPLDTLTESVLDTDPTGREMRPLPASG